MCSPLCVFVVDVPKKANAFGGKIRRKPNPKGAQASTRVIPNAPPIRFQSVCRAICRRPSWHVWACPSLTEARPSPVRQKPVGKPVCRPLHVRRGIVCDKPVACPFPVRGKSAAAPPPISECRKMSASDECPPVRSPSLARGESAACREATIPMAEGGRADVHNRPLHPVSRRARTPHEPTQDERHTGSDRTTNERRTNNRRTQTRPLDKRPSQLRRLSIARG